MLGGGAAGRAAERAGVVAVGGFTRALGGLLFCLQYQIRELKRKRRFVYLFFHSLASLARIMQHLFDTRNQEGCRCFVLFLSLVRDACGVPCLAVIANGVPVCDQRGHR